MNKIWIACVASTIALASVSAFAADLTPDERSELRQRADEMQRMRAQNPRAYQDGMRMDRPQGDVKLNKNRGEVKARPKAKKSKRARAKDRIKQTAKKMPGALVRDKR